MISKASSADVRAGGDERARVYFNEYNPHVSSTAYLPLVAGKLQVYAERSALVRRHFRFMPHQFRIDRPDRIVDAHDEPDVAAFSAAIWNERLCLHVAAEVKRRNPNCLIVFGGTQVPHQATAYMQSHPFIDVCVRAEGEEPFRKLLECHATRAGFAGIPNVTHRCKGEIVVNPEEPAQPRDLDTYPSPYLEGIYDELLNAHPDTRFQAIIETNRGCPFLCTFCYWGKGGLSRKYRYFSLERVERELDWIGKNRIAFVYNADSNFGMHQRDEDIAQMMVDTKLRYGFPEKVVNLYGKNTNDRIFEIGQLLSRHGLHKGMGLSRQSMSEPVLVNVRRKNIRLDVYESLQKRFERANVSVFSELIIGLPGETYASFAEGIQQLLETSLGCNLLIALCEIYPNTEMANPDYLRKHGIVTRKNRSVGVHAKVRNSRWVSEFIDYVVATDSMPADDWRRTCRMSFTTMALTGMRLGYHVLQYLSHRFGTRHVDFIRFLSEGRGGAATAPLWHAELAHYDAFLDQIVAGEGRAVSCSGYGDIYWAIEETTFLRLTAKLPAFYSEMHRLMGAFLSAQGKAFDDAELGEVALFERLCTPSPEGGRASHTFSFNLPEFFSKLKAGSPAKLVARPQSMDVESRDYAGNLWEFARDKLLWARRGGEFAAEFTWHDTATTPLAQRSA